jgi:hypothetical protein
VSSFTNFTGSGTSRETTCWSNDFPAKGVSIITLNSRTADIPFYQPTKFEPVVNLKAAKKFGLSVSEPLLARADELIE